MRIIISLPHRSLSFSGSRILLLFCPIWPCRIPLPFFFMLFITVEIIIIFSYSHILIFICCSRGLFTYKLCLN